MGMAIADYVKIAAGSKAFSHDAMMRKAYLKAVYINLTNRIVKSDIC